jgi:hypothetical protein
VITRLDLDVVIDPAEKRLVGEGRASLRLEGRQSPALMLALGQTGRFLTFEPIHAVAGSVDISERLAIIYFEDPALRGTELEVRFGFIGQNEAYQFIIDPRGAAASWVTGWYPYPSDGTHKAPGTTRLSVPAGWRTLSNGKLSDVSTDGDRRVETWISDAPVARSFAAGQYYVEGREVGGREISVYLLPETTPRATAYIDSMLRCIAALESRFGPLPYPGYALAEMPDSLVPWGGSSEQGFSMVKSSLLSDDDAFLPLVAHELAHSWWGNYVGWRRPGPFMVSEALAQYGAVVAVETIEGQMAATELLSFGRKGPGVGKSAKGYFWLRWKGRDETLMNPTRGNEDLGHALANSKGAWVYHMLRERVGDDLFFGTLRWLANQYGGGSISMVDLRRAFTDSAPPGCRLETFFAQWLDRTGAPRLDFEWSDVSQADVREVEVLVRQRDQAYDLDLDVAVDSRQGTVIHRVHLSQTEQGFTLIAAGRPTGIRLDPEYHLLMWRPEYDPQGFWLYPLGKLLAWQVGCVFLLGLVSGLAQSLMLGMGIFSRHDTMPVLRELFVALVAGTSSVWLGWWGLGLGIVLSILLYWFGQRRIREYEADTLGRRS